MSNQIIHPAGWAPAKGYANGVLTPDGVLYVGGQIGWTAAQVFESHDFIGQMGAQPCIFVPYYISQDNIDLHTSIMRCRCTLMRVWEILRR